MSASTVQFSLEDFRHSGDKEVWSWANEYLGCFEKDPRSLFYRNLGQMYIPCIGP
jgi:hypothetical protein